MEAKEIICQGCGQKIDNPKQYHPIECCISFKAGQESVLTDDYQSMQLDHAYQGGKQEGRKDVVEFVLRYAYDTNGDIHIVGESWQAFLKERGL